MLLLAHPYFFVIHPFSHVITTEVYSIILYVHRRILSYICILSDKCVLVCGCCSRVHNGVHECTMELLVRPASYQPTVDVKSL